MLQGLRFLVACTILGCLATGGVAAPPAAPLPSAAPAAGGDEFKQTISPFLATHCLKCHGPDKQSGDFRVDDVSSDRSKDAERWQRIADQIRDGLMPPKKQPRPPEAASKAVLAWVAAGSGAVAVLPNKGNLIPHEALFGKPPTASSVSPSRLWLLSPDGYQGWVRDVSRGRNQGIVQPFSMSSDRGLRDYAALYTIDEQSTQILVRNAESIVEAQTLHAMKDGKLQGMNDTVREFVLLMHPTVEPTRAQLEAAVQMQFRLATGRAATAEEVTRYLGLYDRCLKDGDRPAAARTMLQAVLLRADAMYRTEVGGAATGDRRMLSPAELARAISLAIGDRRDDKLVQAATKGELTTREQVASHVNRILNDPKADKSRLLRFFREYFEYHRALDVFKDRPADRIKHLPHQLVNDTDRLVLHVLAEDKDVLKQLLTTPLSFVNVGTKQDKQTRKDYYVEADTIPPPRPKDKPEWVGGVTQVYGFQAWPKEQPAVVPSEQRLGILMQPSWLVAHSTNFDNDPVRRGRWVRERLLGGTVPDLPIGVAAMVPDEPHRTFRDRLTVTRAERCWVCHRRMDDLGLPFEQFDHYGRFRTAELVKDVDATIANVDKKGKPLGDVLKPTALQTGGLIADSGEPALDGVVADPRELVRKLAGSERVRQVFVRHAFRYFMGRNESIADAQTLQEADRAYVRSGGSFKAMVESLLTSDAFLYRAAPIASGTAANVP